MRLYIVRGYWRRSTASDKPTLILDQPLVAEGDEDAMVQAEARWRQVWPSLDGEPVATSATALDEVDGRRIIVA